MEESTLGNQAPTETVAGLERLLQYEGHIVTQYVGPTLAACIQLLPVRALRRSNVSLDEHTLLGRVYRVGVFQLLEEDDWYVHGWFSRNGLGGWLLRRVLDQYCDHGLAALVSVRTDKLLRSYLNMGCKIMGKLDGVYEPEDHRYLLRMRQGPKADLVDCSPTSPDECNNSWRARADELSCRCLDEVLTGVVGLTRRA